MTKYTKEALEEAAKDSKTITDVCKKVSGRDKISPSTVNLVSKKLKAFGIDTSHFLGSAISAGNLDRTRRDFTDILTNDPSRARRRGRSQLLPAMLSEGVCYRCSECGNEGFHNGKPLILHIDHVDGLWYNNEISNLRFLCPNCHSQQETSGYSTEKYK